MGLDTSELGVRREAGIGSGVTHPETLSSKVKERAKTFLKQSVLWWGETSANF